jgi:stearoyl-CoA desaturase (delta-9 desaturase)
MDSILFAGVFDLPWWGYAIVALLLTHVTIVSVTVFLHRHQAHHALDLHPLTSHFFRFWLWLTTGMKTREWVAIHRKHHAKCETPDDPHSPQMVGINRVLWGGVLLYVKESHKPETMVRYGQGTPDDWVERNLYSRYVLLGLTTMGVLDVILFGIVPGVLILLTQIIWIPFWAAGVINGVGHYYGYRSWETADASTNILPWGILIGGEELHNNHHAYILSAKLSNKWFEFDIGWMYIRLLEMLGLARVKRVAPMPHFAAPKAVVDAQTLQSVIANRYDVMARYAASLERTFGEERAALLRSSPAVAPEIPAFALEAAPGEKIPALAAHPEFNAVLAKSRPLQTMFVMRRELMALWARSSASQATLVSQLQDWCHRAESSNIRPLAEFAQRLRSYA